MNFPDYQAGACLGYKIISTVIYGISIRRNPIVIFTECQIGLVELKKRLLVYFLLISQSLNLCIIDWNSIFQKETQSVLTIPEDLGNQINAQKPPRKAKSECSHNPQIFDFDDSFRRIVVIRGLMAIWSFIIRWGGQGRERVQILQLMKSYISLLPLKSLYAPPLFSINSNKVPFASAFL